MTSISRSSLNSLAESVGSFTSVVVHSRQNTYREILGPLNDRSLDSFAAYTYDNRLATLQSSIDN